MLGKPLVHERVVCRQQIENAAILADDALEEQLDFTLERVAQVVVEVGEQVHDRLGGLQRANTQPLSREIGDERL